MLIREIVGHVLNIDISNRTQDILDIEWYETTKRIARRTTRNGQDIALKLLQEKMRLQDGDILHMDEQQVIIIHIKPCEVLRIAPVNMREMAAICYEIGNKHLPLYIEGEALLIPYEAPIDRWLQASGYNAEKTTTQLLHPLQTSVTPHGNDTSLFTKILQFAAGN
ncbi:urease accessory protein [Chitinophaga skermanii]|uniref:Urease accessory protein UreE n=1 Tax=Chitinophaga skermanii TaxID=331697 RepID=A0A327R4B3_9BACT|nr:urease accessory protein UreE [Chitinophaga skermanii]RAJ10898.1 urease accessory protein [Chitinophaga skermanii]